MQREMTGAEMVIQALVDQGVEHIFGYPGGAVLPIYDALFQQEKLQHILVRHEQGAVHAAEGYARSSGKVGAVLVTSGPGATNAVTGLTDALMDSIPIVVITGQVPTHLIGNDAFQECDTVGITRPCTKHNSLVKDVNDLSRVLHEAFYVAANGRPGPVVVDIPKDIQFAKGMYVGPKNIQHKTIFRQPRGVPVPKYEITIVSPIIRAAYDKISVDGFSNRPIVIDIGLECASVIVDEASPDLDWNRIGCQDAVYNLGSYRQKSVSTLLLAHRVSIGQFDIRSVIQLMGQRSREHVVLIKSV